MDKQTSTSLSEKSYVAPIKHLLNLEGVTSLIYDLLYNGKIIRDFDKKFREEAKKKVDKLEEKFKTEIKIEKEKIKIIFKKIQKEINLINLKEYILLIQNLFETSTKNKKKIEEISTFPKEREFLIEDFFKIREKLLEILKNNEIEYLPWQLSECCSIDPEGKPNEQIVDFGGAVYDANGNNLYGIDCHYCGCMVRF